MNKETNIPNNSEVEGVKFEIPSYDGAVKYYNETATPKMIKLVMKLSGGAIKSEKQAEYVLLGFVIVAMGISLFLVFGGGSNGSSNNRSRIYQEDLTPTARETIPEDILKTIPYKNAK